MDTLGKLFVAVGAILGAVAGANEGGRASRRFREADPQAWNEVNDRLGRLGDLAQIEWRRDR